MPSLARRGVQAKPTPLLDLISGVTAAYSLRRLRAAYAGSAVKVRRTSDSTTLDIGFDAAGNLDQTALLAFVAGTDGYIDTWYDQSTSAINLPSGGSTHDMRIAVAGVIDTKLRGRPAAKALNSSAGYVSAQFTAYTGTTLSAAMVGTLETSTANGRWLTVMGATGDTSSATAEGSILFLRSASTSNWVTNRNGALSTKAGTPGALTQLATVYDGTNNILYVDNVAGTTVASTGAFNARRVAIGMTNPTTYLGISNNAFFCEAIFKLAAGAWSAGDLLTIANSQKLYYGTA